MLTAGTPSLECIIEDFSEANTGKGRLRIDYERNSNGGSGLL